MIGRAGGHVVRFAAREIAADMLGARVGGAVSVVGARRIVAQVIGIERGRAHLAALNDPDGIAIGDRVLYDALAARAIVGTALLGRAVDASGVVLDAGPPLWGRRSAVDVCAAVLGERRPVIAPLWTGVRALDGPLTIGRGARVGLFGAPGAGKSTLLESIVNGSVADATVVALIGERGREAERWLRRLEPHTTIVCATSDRSPAERVRASEVAFAHADALRARGLHVLLVLDSLARFAAAARDLALQAGEAVGRAGYPPSVAGRQARLLERAGSTAAGSVTLIATVLSEGAINGDPIADAARAALDGHIVLCTRLAGAGWYPAIDLPASASRTMVDVAGPAHARAARILRAAVAELDASREARAVGLDVSSGNPSLARAIAFQGEISTFLQQDGRPVAFAETLKHMTALADSLG